MDILLPRHLIDPEEYAALINVSRVFLHDAERSNRLRLISVESTEIELLIWDRKGVSPSELIATIERELMIKRDVHFDFELFLGRAESEFDRKLMNIIQAVQLEHGEDIIAWDEINDFGLLVYQLVMGSILQFRFVIALIKAPFPVLLNFGAILGYTCSCFIFVTVVNFEHPLVVFSASLIGKMV